MRLRTTLWIGCWLWLGTAGCGGDDSALPDDGGSDAPSESLPDVPDETEGDAGDAEVGGDVADDGGEAEAVLPGWQPPVEWRRPIDDYVADVQETLGLGPDEFDHALKELEVFDDRLYLGYGDWTQNTGRAVGMQVRYFADPAGEAATEFPIEEESIDYYRVLGDTLFIPGVDATEDALIGNVFYKPSGGAWTKVRSLAENLHVMDVFEHAGTVFASGGGCDDMDHYYANDDQGLLYRSEDGGATWAIELAWHDDDPAAVVRYEFFAQVEGNLYVFGNTINASTGTLTNVPRRWDGGSWTPVELLPSAWVLRSHQFDEITAVVRGVDLGTGRFRAWRVLAGETVRPLVRLDAAELYPVDFFVAAPGELLVLARDGNAYPDRAAAPFTYRVWRTTDLAAWDELLVFASDVPVASLARWRDALYLGTGEGAILRSEYVPE